MYPISFDNPNSGNGHPKAANRNFADDETITPKPSAVPFDAARPETGQPDPTGHDSNFSNSLLVVECRRDDKWRVEMCTDLSELDSAMDMARDLRGSPGVDEVSLTLEISGDYGRESRREVLRFAPETAETYHTSVIPDPVHMQNADVAAGPDANDDDQGMAVLNATVKIPDYEVDTLDFSEFAMPERAFSEFNNESCRGNGDDDARAQFYAEAPVDLEALSGSGKTDQEAARRLFSSIYGAEPESTSEDNAIRVNMPPPQREYSDWLDRTQADADQASARSYSQGYRLEAGNNPDDDTTETFRLPVLAQQNGLAAKLLVFTGTIALLVLGGALAELLAVDITTPANAGVGVFDTFSAVSGSLTR